MKKFTKTLVLLGFTVLFIKTQGQINAPIKTINSKNVNMKTIVSFLLLVSLLIFQISHAQEPYLYSSEWDWEKIDLISDEFDISTSINTDKWKDHSSSRNLRESYVNPENLKFELGSDNISQVLKLIGKKEPITVWINYPDYQWIDFIYQSAVLKSTVLYGYGYFEIRAKLPDNKNTNTIAFWMHSCQDIIPPDPPVETEYSEIDILETQTVFPYLYPIAIHTGLNSNCSADDHHQECNNIKFDHNQDFHVYGLDWYPDRIDWYVDGRLFRSLTDDEFSVDILNNMNVLFWNCKSYGIDPLQSNSVTDDEFEVDYFRFFKRKPNITLDSYNNVTKRWGYKGTTGNNVYDDLRWEYDETQIVDVVEWYDVNEGIAYINFRTNAKDKGEKPIIKLIAQQVFPRKIVNDVDNVTIESENSIAIGYDNPEFSYGPPYFSDNCNCLNIKTHAVATTEHSHWSIGIKNSDGTVDWSSPQTQYGKTANFTNLLSGKTYVIKHGVYNFYVPWKETRKEIEVKFDADFYVDEPTWENNQLNLHTHQVNTNPHSQWKLALINDDGTVTYLEDQNQFGQDAVFTNLIPGGKYQVTHGNYGINQEWVGMSKIINIDLNSNFESHNEFDKCSKGWAADGNSITVYARGNNYASRFSLFELDEHANYIHYSSPIQGPIYAIYGDPVTFDNLEYNKIYGVRHGVYTPNGIWRQTWKTFKTPPNPNTITCDKNSKIDLTANSDSFSESQLHKDIFIYPNPTNGTLNIQISPEFKVYKIEIKDQHGKTIKSINDVLSKTSIDFSSHAKGMYFAIIYYNDGVKVEKIIFL